VDEIYRSLVATFPEPDRVVGVPLRRCWAWSNSESNLETLHNEFRATLDNLNIEKLDSVYILNRSAAAVRFAEMLRPKEMCGFRGDDAAPDFPMAYIETMFSNPDAPPAHLADIWASLGDATLSSSDYPPSLAQRFHSTLPTSEKRVGIFVGAGDTARTCSPDYWKEFLSGIANTVQEIVLFGTESDREAAKTIEEFCHKKNLQVRNAVARTELLPLGSLLTSCNLVIGSDTGGIHFAAALGIPVLGIYFAGARAAFTGPYAACARVLETETVSTEIRIPPPEDTAHVATALLNGDGKAVLRLTLGFVIRSPVFDHWGLLYQSSSERNPVSEKARERLWQDFQQIRHAEEKIQRKPVKKPVTIIIPSAGQTHLTRECLAAIGEECRELAVEILVVTADSSTAQEDYSTATCEVTTIQVTDGSSFACLCNRGAKVASGDLLLFLNNDTLAERGWLKSLLASYSENAPCIVSPLLLYWDGLVQNAGISISVNAIGEIKHGTWPKNLSGAVECDAVSGTAILVSKEVFQRFGGFDEEYINGYEDLDFCLRARKQGIRCFVDCQARVRHYRGATPGRYQAEERNRARFEQKWFTASQFPPPSPASRGESLYPPVHGGIREGSRNTNLCAPLVCVICAEEWWTAGSRVRWAGPLARLERSGMLRAKWCFASDDEAIWNEFLDDLSRSSLVILRRPLTTVAAHERLNELIHRARVPLLVDMDDVFLGRFPANSMRGKDRLALEESFARLLKEAQIVTASTPTLSSSVERYCRNVKVLPNTVDPLWWPQAHKTIVSRDEIAVSFFGSPLHGLDLANIAPALANFLDEEKGRVKLFVWGAFPEVLRTHPMVRQGGPFVTDYEVHLQRLANKPVDFAVVPLLDSPANRARSLIRFLELGWYGIPAVYSCVGEYAVHLKRGQDGLLVGETTDEWLAALRMMSHNIELRENIAAQARGTVEESWIIEKHIQDYVDVLSSLGIEERAEDAVMETVDV
jgi:GT2 family glycosyltransferase/ADP-heptose:LPS heptosyltransferase